MNPQERLSEALNAAMDGARTALVAADQLCQACVALLEVDGAAISLMHDGTTRGTFGSSGDLSRRLDEFQFTFGEGPCLDAALGGSPVLIPDLDETSESRWPAFRGAMLASGVSAVFALPVRIASTSVGALDLFRRRAGPLTTSALSGGLLAADLGALPLLDLMGSNLDRDATGPDEAGSDWQQLASLERGEVYQATGMIMGAWDVTAVEALVRLRAYAYTTGSTASELAGAVVERRVRLDGGDWPAEPESLFPGGRP